jgi:SpoVK/Ycf46/Vps4 family AAA+-type ATPase
MVGIGELGTDVDTLENRLRDILTIAADWNAVLLLDECDIFLEARDTNNIQRNAMVGVFLRLLEYYQGVLFMTTNRATNLDQAFDSRISMKLSFPNLGEDTRKQIWDKIVGLHGLTTIDTTLLAAHDLNGRQIKNVTKLATSYAKWKDRPVTTEDFTRVIKQSEEFDLQRNAH